jgi:putative ABC transport system substrate-binding protein
MALAHRHRLPAIYGFRQYITEGALISYGPNTADIVRRSAAYVDRILKGEKPADLPVQAPTKYDLIIRTCTHKSGLWERRSMSASLRKRPNCCAAAK